ncbi:MAG TPA: DUF1697 domain-containing protein [Gemmataceae bacterium]|jgi:uncharacterized protein (DUF1697 family)|nr:DUF1697 domain-containing protein [Gemmataceae bacterium]
MPAKASPMRVALLRGINVGGHNKVAMSDLRELCEGLGLADVKTVLQSGNLVFHCDRQDDATLESLLEAETAKRLGVSADYIVRGGDELARVVARNPFPKEAKNDPSHLLVMFLKAAPRAHVVETLRAGIKGRETIATDGKQLYIVYPDGIGRSKLTGTLIERILETKGTARNWNTILKLLALCE